MSNINKVIIELNEEELELVSSALSNRKMHPELTPSEWESLVHRKLTLTKTIGLLESLEDNCRVLRDTNKLALKLR